jgi:selenocysteine lyase/cysteine desulfurase
MTAPTLGIDDYAHRFADEPGYLDFARVGPVGHTVEEEQQTMAGLLGRARFGSLDTLQEQDARLRDAVSALTGFRADQVVFQPSTSHGLMQVLFGLTGKVALSPAEFPSLTFATVRAADALRAVSPIWLETDGGRVTPGNLRRQLTAKTTAVAVSLVDFRTGYLVDLEGIRQVIGDRLLIVDAIQGFGVVDAPYEVADVVVTGGQKWVRAGWGTGFLVLSDRAIERLSPVFSGFSATDVLDVPVDDVPAPARGARAFSITNPDPIAEARFAAALEEIASVGVSAIRQRIIETTTLIMELADRFGIPVISSRNENERAGIVVLEPAADQFTVLAASLHNFGLTTTQRGGTVRLSAHATTSSETLDMLRSSFVGFASATTV